MAKAERRERTLHWLGVARGAIAALPADKTPTAVDDVAKAATLGLLSAITGLLRSGKEPHQIVAELSSRLDEGAARLDLDAIAEKMKAELAGDEEG